MKRILLGALGVLGLWASAAVLAAPQAAGQFEWRAGLAALTQEHTWRHEGWVGAVAFPPMASAC